MSSSQKEVSVIIPVYRDWSLLDACLACLDRQTKPRSDFEIIIVSNEPDRQGLDARSAQLRARGVLGIHEPKGYSYAARNAGIAAAQGEILAFTDADCLPEPVWLQEGVRVLRTEAVDLVGGQINMVGESRTAAADYDRIFGLSQEAFYTEHGGFATANVLVKRCVVESLGGFDATLRSGGDFEFCRRAHAAGFSLKYIPEAVVSHPVRASLRELLNKNLRVCGGALDRRRQQPADERESLRAFWWRRLRPPVLGWWRILAGTEHRTREFALFRRVRLVGLQNVMFFHRIFSLLWLSLQRSESRGVTER